MYQWVCEQESADGYLTCYESNSCNSACKAGNACIYDPYSTTCSKSSYNYIRVQASA